ERGRLVPVIVVEDEASAAPLADALVAGGLRCAEVTFRTSAAQAALRVMAADGRLLVGAGTVVTTDQFNAAVVRRCIELGVATFPGVATASDVMAAVQEELDIVKFFPAEPLGGVKMISALAAPFPSMRFIPTGGITAELLPRYLAHPAVAAVGG